MIQTQQLFFAIQCVTTCHPKPQNVPSHPVDNVFPQHSHY